EPFPEYPRPPPDEFSSSRILPASAALASRRCAPEWPTFRCRAATPQPAKPPSLRRTASVLSQSPWHRRALSASDRASSDPSLQSQAPALRSSASAGPRPLQLAAFHPQLCPGKDGTSDKSSTPPGASAARSASPQSHAAISSCRPRPRQRG